MAKLIPAASNELYENDEAEQTVPLNIRIPAELKEAFLAKCAEHGTTMTKVLRKFIEREVS